MSTWRSRFEKGDRVTNVTRDDMRGMRGTVKKVEFDGNPWEEVRIWVFVTWDIVVVSDGRTRLTTRHYESDLRHLTLIELIGELDR